MPRQGNGVELTLWCSTLVTGGCTEASSDRKLSKVINVKYLIKVLKRRTNRLTARTLFQVGLVWIQGNIGG